jgi:hypothetical protein
LQLVMSRRRVPCLDSYFDKVNLLVWPRFKAIFDMHLASVKTANVRALWEDDVHAHYVTRRYAEFASAMVQLNTEGGDQQVSTPLNRAHGLQLPSWLHSTRCWFRRMQRFGASLWIQSVTVTGSLAYRLRYGTPCRHASRTIPRPERGPLRCC